MDSGRNGHHGQYVHDPVVLDIWSAIEVALTLRHNIADWTVQLMDTVFCITSRAMNTTVQVWPSDVFGMEKRFIV